jgi:hypothetical protein
LRFRQQAVDFVEEQRAALCNFNQARTVGSAPVKAPFATPNSSLSKSVSGSVPQFTAMKGSGRRLLM